MNNELMVGKLLSGRPFVLPRDYQVHTFALIGIRGSGKTVAATVIAEEMNAAGLPFVTIDPVGVWWGLRCNPDGSPGGLPVVIIGGSHADLPLEKDSGERVADAILEHNISCVIDMSGESKNTVRKFVTDFCDRLMDLNPSGTRHLFLEEAPELVPQRPLGEQKRSLAAVDRLVRLGRNKGYGCTLVSQRFATINKDVLTQCESLIALRCIGKHDRDAASDWIAEVVHDTESKKKADKFIHSLTQLENGEAWFWSPQWLKEFVQVQFRRRHTFHPGETRNVGQSAVQVQLLNVGDFVDRFRSALTREKPKRPKSDVTEDGRLTKPAVLPRSPQDAEQIERLTNEVNELRQLNSAMIAVLDSVRSIFEPQFNVLKTAFASLDSLGSNHSKGNASVWEPWKEKLGGKAASMIDALLQRGELTRTQLATLTGQSPKSGSYANNMSSLNRNGLIEKNGDKIRLQQI